jgi:hypothetical protein
MRALGPEFIDVTWWASLPDYRVNGTELVLGMLAVEHPI